MEKTGDVRPLVTLYINFAFYLVDNRDDLNNATLWINKAQKLSSEHRFDEPRAYIEAILGRISLKQADYVTALRHIERAIRFAEEHNLSAMLPNLEELKTTAEQAIQEA